MVLSDPVVADRFGKTDEAAKKTGMGGIMRKGAELEEEDEEEKGKEEEEEEEEGEGRREMWNAYYSSLHLGKRVVTGIVSVSGRRKISRLRRESSFSSPGYTPQASSASQTKDDVNT
jgi:hypothetical protein